MKKGFLIFKENVSLSPAGGVKMLVNFTKGQKIPATRKTESSGVPFYSYSFEYNGMPFVIMYGLNGVVFEEEDYGEIMPVPYVNTPESNMKYTIRFIENAALAPADGRKMLVNFVKGESFPAKKISENGGIAVFGFERDGVPFSITPETMPNIVILIPETDFTTQPAPTPGETPSGKESLPFGLTPTSGILVAGLVVLSFYLILKK
jgi:hypothetical protein